MIKVDMNILNRVSQGDIYKDVEYFESFREYNGVIEISKITFPYVVVLTQDCDLAQDFTNRSNQNKSKGNHLMISVLVAPIYNAEHVCKGEHLSELNLTMAKIDKYKKKDEMTTDYKRLLQNETPRYHYLDFTDKCSMVPSIIDFKHYFSLNAQYLYDIKNKNFVCRVSKLYREDISQRFASFLSRIGLPEEKISNVG